MAFATVKWDREVIERYELVIPSGKWQRVAIVALLVIPLLLILMLSALGWLLLPFLPKDGKEAMLKLADLALEWIKTAIRAA